MASTAYQDESNGAMLVGTAAFFLALTYLSVGLRTYVRVALTKSFQTDDWLMLAAQVRTGSVSLLLSLLGCFC